MIERAIYRMLMGLIASILLAGTLIFAGIEHDLALTAVMTTAILVVFLTEEPE